MKRMFFYIVLMSVFCGHFVAHGRVVCANPQTGNESLEAAHVSDHACNPNATEGADRDVNEQQIVATVSATAHQETTSEKGKKTGGSSGGTQ